MVKVVLAAWLFRLSFATAYATHWAPVHFAHALVILHRVCCVAIQVRLMRFLTDPSSVADPIGALSRWLGYWRDRSHCLLILWRQPEIWSDFATDDLRGVKFRREAPCFSPEDLRAGDVVLQPLVLRCLKWKFRFRLNAFGIVPSSLHAHFSETSLSDGQIMNRMALGSLLPKMQLTVFWLLV